MSTDTPELPWDALLHKEGDIPWPALRTLAEAVVGNTDVVQELSDLYTQAHKAALTEICYGDLYVPAIFALAARKLDDQARREIGAFLIEKLVSAGREDDDLSLEVLTASVGTMGPPILPAVLDAISREEDARGAWIFLWDLTLLATEAEDSDVRERVVRACVELLERADRGETDTWDAAHAAWTLAALKRTEYTDLLQRLTNKTIGWFDAGEYREALRRLQGNLDYASPPELWERPVEEWLKSQWRSARDWYVQRQATPPIPIVEHASKIGRNEPCPCGSGKKYKKCCGSSANQETGTS